VLEMLKRMRTEAPSSSSHSVASIPPTSTKGKARAATVEDAPEEEEDENNDSFAPGGDADYFAEEDGEGRFFGGGLTDEQKNILNIFDGAGGEGAAAEDVSTMITPGDEPDVLLSQANGHISLNIML
jgi:beta-catenin-like protein 1